MCHSQICLLFKNINAAVFNSNVHNPQMMVPFVTQLIVYTHNIKIICFFLTANKILQ